MGSASFLCGVPPEPADREKIWPHAFFILRSGFRRAGCFRAFPVGCTHPMFGRPAETRFGPSLKWVLDKKRGAFLFYGGSEPAGAHMSVANVAALRPGWLRPARCRGDSAIHSCPYVTHLARRFQKQRSSDQTKPRCKTQSPSYPSPLYRCTSICGNGIFSPFVPNTLYTRSFISK